MSGLPATFSPAFPFDDVPVLDLVAGRPSLAFTAPPDTPAAPGAANRPRLRIVDGVTGVRWLDCCCCCCPPPSTTGAVGLVGSGGDGDADGAEIVRGGASIGGCAGGGIGGSTGEGVSPGTSPKFSTPLLPPPLRRPWLAGLSRIDDGTVGGKSGVDVAERVARMLGFFPPNAPPPPPAAAAAAARSAGEGRLRAGRLVALDSSPLDEVFGRFADVALRIRPAGGCDEGPGCGRPPAPPPPEAPYASSIGLEIGGSSLRSSSPGDGSGKPGLWKTRFAGAECGAAGSMWWWGIWGMKPPGSMPGFCTIAPMPLPLEWRSMGETKSVFWVARSSVDETASVLDGAGGR